MRTPDPSAVVLAFGLGAVLAAVAAPAAAQYKWVDANGTVTYSDLPPPPSVMATTLPPVDRSRAEDGMLPATLRATAAKHPVTLYTTAGCTPCQQARTHLSRRGIPHAERTVRTAADANAFRDAGFGENAFPTLQVGRERGVGYEEGEWDRLLDTAGYPGSSQLPASYRAPPPRALAASERPAPARAASNDSGDAASAPVSEADGALPGGASRAARRQASASRADAPAAMPPTGTSTIRF
jgi:glutaredoxin